MKNYKIVCICQIYNEIKTGNLPRFIRQNKEIFDELIFYDDASTDGSYQYALEHTPYVIRGMNNSFVDEVAHRQLMLDLAMKMDTDFVFWLDADEILPVGADEILQRACLYCIENHFDALSFHEINLWRSQTWYRTDSLFNDGWFVRLWKVKPGIQFHIQKGLHKQLYPCTIEKIGKFEGMPVIHYGFSSKEEIIRKYLLYRHHGQRGYIMLDRLIDEEYLTVEKVPRSMMPPDLYFEEGPLEKWSKTDALKTAYEAKKLKNPRYSIACLIYKSVEWAEFVYNQVLKYTDLDDVEFFFVANDATEAVISYLKNNYIPHYQFVNEHVHRTEWYINNVYRAYNYAARCARGDVLIFINSDMAFSENWLEGLINAYDGTNCVASRLVESGKMVSGLHGIERNFGRSFDDYDECRFLEYSRMIKEDRVDDGGLYMPLLINKSDFLKVGGYPEGNIVPESDVFSPVIAKKGEENVSGDKVLIMKLNHIGVRHVTAFNSIAYHFQCGELEGDISADIGNQSPKIAICNDLIHGSMGEKVLWGFMEELLPATVGISLEMVGGKKGYSASAKEYIERNYPSVEIIIQNATFIDRVDSSKTTIAFLQDNLRAMGRPSRQQELVLSSADYLVTNSVLTAQSYPEYEFEIIPVGVDSDLFIPQDKLAMREKYGINAEKVGIFVGSLSCAKGWAEVQKCIECNQDIYWIIVSKYDEVYTSNNVKMFNRVSQSILSQLYNCADFFILGSPVETQCLAAIEACLCNIPVLMKNTGIFKEFTEEDKSKVGIFTDNLASGIKLMFEESFSPRETVLKRNITINDSVAMWQSYIESVIQTEKQSKIKKYGREGLTEQYKAKSRLRFEWEYFWKFYILSGRIYSDGVPKALIRKFLLNRLPAPLQTPLKAIYRLIKHK